MGHLTVFDWDGVRPFLGSNVASLQVPYLTLNITDRYKRITPGSSGGICIIFEYVAHRDALMASGN